MWDETDADSDIDADVPVVIGALDHLDVPLLNTDFDGIGATVVGRANSAAALAAHQFDGLADRVFAVGEDGGLLAQNLDESDDWDVVDARVLRPEDDDLDESLA